MTDEETDGQGFILLYELSRGHKYHNVTYLTVELTV